MLQKTLPRLIPMGFLPTAQRGHDKKLCSDFLCSNDAAGSVIGRKGTIVRALENETGASIRFAAPTTGSVECVVTISALENLESGFSPAQNAVVLVFARSVEGDIEKGFILGFSQGASVTAKLLVSSDLVGCLSENEGKVISEIRELSGADIQILGGDFENQVVQTVEAGHSKAVANGREVLTKFGGDLEVASGNKLAMVTNTIVEIVVSRHAFGSIYGEDGDNLNSLREISGAKVKVHDPRPGESEGKLVISGTPDQTLAAQSLLQAFIQTAKKSQDQKSKDSNT